MKYFEYKRQDKEETKTTSTIMIAKQTATTLNIRLADMIHERGKSVSVYIYRRRGYEQKKRSKFEGFVGFHSMRKWKYSSNGPTFGSFLRS